MNGFSAGLADESNIFEWYMSRLMTRDILIIGPEGTLYEGGFFKAKLDFPRDYPLNPPTMRFTSEIYHPNVYPDGRVCISILHPPGEDKYGYEEAGERWLPIHTVETIGNLVNAHAHKKKSFRSLACYRHPMINLQPTLKQR